MSPSWDILETQSPGLSLLLLARARSTQVFSLARYLEVSLLSFPSIQFSSGESRFDGKITQFMFMYLKHSWHEMTEISQLLCAYTYVYIYIYVCVCVFIYIYIYTLHYDLVCISIGQGSRMLHLFS